MPDYPRVNFPMQAAYDLTNRWLKHKEQQQLEYVRLLTAKEESNKDISQEVVPVDEGLQLRSKHNMLLALIGGEETIIEN